MIRANGIRIDGELAILGESSLPIGASLPGPFRHTTLAAWTRLDWPGGTADIAQPPVYWGERYAATLVDGIAVIDARNEHSAVLEIALPGATSIAIHDGWLRIGVELGTLSVPCIALERLEPGPVELVVQVRYPRRNADARLPTKVGWLYDNGDALVHVRRGRMFVDAREYGITKTVPFELCDELWPGQFAAIEVPGQPRRALHAVETERTYRGVVIAGLPPHPLRHSMQPATLRIERVAPLLERLADEPDDDANRSVLLDALQEEGAPYARALAEARDAKRFAVEVLEPLIGPLSAIFERIQYRGGLPWSAQLRPQMPTDDALLALVGTDVRLAMLTAIQRGSASTENYVRVLGMPLAIGLRRVDSCTREVLQALADAKRDRLTSLGDVPLAKDSVQRLLATPTFDRVVDMDVRVSTMQIESLLAAIVADNHGAFARAPRTLRVLHHHGSAFPDPPAVLAAWSRLPLAGLHVGAVSLVRHGEGTVARLGPGAPTDTASVVRRLIPGVTIEPT